MHRMKWSHKVLFWKVQMFDRSLFIASKDGSQIKTMPLWRSTTLSYLLQRIHSSIGFGSSTLYSFKMSTNVFTTVETFVEDVRLQKKQHTDRKSNYKKSDLQLLKDSHWILIQQPLLLHTRYLWTYPCIVQPSTRGRVLNFMQIKSPLNSVDTNLVDLYY